MKRIADEEIEKDEDKKRRNNHSKKCYLTKLPLIPQKKLRIIKFLVLFFLHGPEDYEINTVMSHKFCGKFFMTKEGCQILKRQ